ncbi:NfeD family protein [Frateuria aurantia]
MVGLPGQPFWWVLALLLTLAEVVFSGYSLLWIALGAAFTGAVHWCWPGLPMGAQVVCFVGMSFAASGWSAWRRRRQRPRWPSNVLNRRGDQLLGQQFVLMEPIVEGHGRVRVGDGSWLVQGPDLPAGSRVRVIAVRGIVLDVVAGDTDAV